MNLSLSFAWWVHIASGGLWHRNLYRYIWCEAFFPVSLDVPYIFGVKSFLLNTVKLDYLCLLFFLVNYFF